MLVRNIIWLAVMGCLGIAPCQADDVADVLLAGRKAFGDIIIRPQVTLERRQGVWCVAGVGPLFQGLTDGDLGRLAGLTSLDTLNLQGDNHCTDKGFEMLAGLHNLRHLALPRNLTDNGMKAAISGLNELEDLDLSECGEIGDKVLIYLRNLPKLRRLSPPSRLTEAALHTLVSSLPELENVDLSSRNQMGDKVLVYLKNLPKLRRVSLENMGLRDALLTNIKPLTRLEELDLRANGLITDAGVAELRGLDSLRVLKLDKVGAAGVATLGEFPHLEQFIVSTYVVAGREGDLSGLRGMKSLTIGKIAGDQAEKVRLPDALEYLKVNHRTGVKLDFKLCRRLDRIELNGDSAARDLKWLSRVPDLKELTYVGPSVNQDVATIAGLISLRALTLDGRCPTVFGDDGMKALGGLRHLESLKIGTSSVTDAGMDALRNLTNLRQLDLATGDGVTAVGLANIWELKKLRSLRLGISDQLQCSVDDVLAHVSALSELEELSIAGTLTDKGLKQLVGLKKLRRLDLTQNVGYTDDGLASLMRELPELQSVKLSFSSPCVQEKKTKK